MMHQSNMKSVPTIPGSWRNVPGIKSSGFTAPREMRLAEDDDFEGGRNWALIILFSAMLSVPLLPCLYYLAS